MNTASAFAPGNISCLFAMCPHDDPAIAGSLGVGFTVDKGVTARVQFSEKTQIFFNDKRIDFPTVESVVQQLAKGNPISVSLSSDLPLGCGFGLSGASALATAYALNDLLGLQKEKLDLAKIAHVAEVENGTGLGDVVNEYFKGFLMKTVPSSRFIVHSLPIKDVPVYCKYFSKISTKDVLSDKDMFDRINKAGRKGLEQVELLVKHNTVTFQNIISIAKEFTIESGLLQDKQVIQTISEIESRGGHASMIILGNAVFSDIPFPGAITLTIC